MDTRFKDLASVLLNGKEYTTIEGIRNEGELNQFIIELAVLLGRQNGFGIANPQKKAGYTNPYVSLSFWMVGSTGDKFSDEVKRELHSKFIGSIRQMVLTRIPAMDIPNERIYEVGPALSFRLSGKMGSTASPETLDFSIDCTLYLYHKIGEIEYHVLEWFEVQNKKLIREYVQNLRKSSRQRKSKIPLRKLPGSFGTGKKQ